MAHSICSKVSGGCGRKFSGISTYDAHLETKDQRNFTCLDPADLGMRWDDDRQIWRSGEEYNFQHATYQADKADEVRECKSCGAEMKKKPGRGRWPHECNDCGGKGIPIKNEA